MSLLTDLNATGLVSKPTYIKHKNLRFLIMDAPTDPTLHLYMDTLRKRKVTVIVRACSPTYSTNTVEKAGIRVVELPFTDGDPPPEDIVTRWLTLVQTELGGNLHTSHGAGEEKNDDKEDANDDSKCIAVHCVAGLGRAPALVCIALIEAGMEKLAAISFVRSKRKGAFNTRQLKYLEAYVPRRSSGKGCCIIS